MPRAKQSTGRDAPTDARAKGARKTSSRRGSEPLTSKLLRREAPARASWCALRRAPEHIALALCEGRESAPEACGVPRGAKRSGK